MSGYCSRHQTHNATCQACLAKPLTEEQKDYYRGWEDGRAAQRRNGWHPVEDCVLDAYDELEAAARTVCFSTGEVHADRLQRALVALNKLRQLHRGFGRS